MNIATTYYSLKFRAFEFYVSGCNGFCKNCCNPELKDFSIGFKFNIKNYLEKLNDSLVERIWILGGDPIDQNHIDLIDMLKELVKIKKELWIWTRYDIKKVNKEVLQYLDYIKCGEYMPEMTTTSNIQYNIPLATSNQKIYKLNKYVYI